MKGLNFLALILLFSLPGFSNTITLENKADSAVIRYLALGDSYTIGESVPQHQSYPYLLADTLNAAGVNLYVDVLAKTGWTSADLLASLDSAVLEKSYDLVSLLIGVNNQYQNRSINEYRKEFTLLLESAIKLAAGNVSNVFVISIPDYGYTPFGEKNIKTISAEIDHFNKINKEISANYGIMYFDITPISRKGLEKPKFVAEDGLHPSGIMYEQWINSFVSQLKPIFN